MRLGDITNIFDEFASLSFQESYDNAGLIIGNKNDEISGALLTIDVTEEVLDEAIDKNCNLIIAHHPIIFKGLKKITGKNYVERVVLKAIKNDIAIYASHTNLDSVSGGVSSMICKKLGLKKCKILSPKYDELMKLVTYAPVDYADEVRDKIFEFGAGSIGNYDSCSFNMRGKGTFRGNDMSNPFIGEKGKIHKEDEIRIETVFPKYMKSKLVSALISVHPYEEVAYDIYPLANKWSEIGMGMVGSFENNLSEKEFLQKLKNDFNLDVIRHTELLDKPVLKVAVCGGSGSFLLKDAIASGADVFVTGDFKYHEFFDAENMIVIADIGHYESEQFTKDIFYELLIKNFPKFAVYLSETNTNPIKFFK